MANAIILPPLAPVAASATSTVSLGDPAYVLNDHAGVVCRLACDAEGNSAGFRLDLGADLAFDTVMAFGRAVLSSAGTLNLLYATAAQGPFTGAYTTVDAVPAYASANPIGPAARMGLVSLPAPVTARYVQLDYHATSAGKSVELARVAIGRRIQLARNFSYGAARGVRDLGALDFSRRGVLLRQRGKHLRTAGLTFSSIYRDEVEATMQPLLERIGNTEPVGLILDPSADPMLERRSYFGPLVGDLGHVQPRAGGFEAKVNLVSLF